MIDHETLCRFLLSLRLGSDKEATQALQVLKAWVKANRQYRLSVSQQLKLAVRLQNNRGQALAVKQSTVKPLHHS